MEIKKRELDGVSIILPHKRTPRNDECLRLFIDAIQAYTPVPYELIMDVSDKCCYRKWDEGIRKAKYDVCILPNTDTIFAPGWITMAEYCMPNAITVMRLVECGAIGVASCNIGQNFGQWPHEFDKQAFEAFAEEHGKTVPEVEEARKWYMPCAFDKNWYISTGGFDVNKGGFPQPLDIWFWDRVSQVPGFKFLATRAYCYHFQCLTGRDTKRIEGAV